MPRGSPLHRAPGTSLLALAAACLVPVADAGAQVTESASASAGRTLSLTLPLVRDGQVYGDVFVQVDPSGTLSIESRSLRDQLAPMLNDAGLVAADQAIGGEPYVTPAELISAGIDLRYDAARLELQLLTIDARLRKLETIGSSASDGGTIASQLPADFSAYLNLSGSAEYEQEIGLRAPSLFMFGAARYRDFVIEADGAFTDDLGDSYRFYRRGVRAVYDDPARFRRLSAGDLRLSTLPILRTQFIGGIAVEKSRRVFDPFSPIASFGGQQIFLDTPSTVEILVNGATYRTLQLPAGAYDLADLPLQYGANDIQLVVRDQAGREQVTSLDHYFDPIELLPGDEEYTAGLGVIARELAFEPDYTGDPAFIGSYRRAISADLLLGGGVQLSEEVQVGAFQARVVPQVLPGAFELQAAASRSDAGFGFAGRAAWRWSSGDMVTARRVTLAADYQSEAFRVIGEAFLLRGSRLSLTGSYSQNLSERTRLVGGATHVSGSAIRSQTTLFADAIHLFDQRFRLSAGVEYGTGDQLSRKFGVRIGLSVNFGPRDRADVVAQSRREFARASYSRANDNTSGSLGYDVGVETFEGHSAADAQFYYTSNRFEAQGVVRTGGDGFGGMIDRQSARLQIGTSLAYAGGAFGIGRPIEDSFALVRPHGSLEGKRVIAGRGLNGGDFEAASGPLGAAVVGRLSSYIEQDVMYDVDDPPPGYDIGAGVTRLDPPFRSGNVITVGSANFVSAFGFLRIAGAPASLVAGSITSSDDPGFTPQPFFTNSAGRFAAIGLAPGRSYVVQLTGQSGSFTIAVPADNEGLYRMDTIELDAAETRSPR